MCDICDMCDMYDMYDLVHKSSHTFFSHSPTSSFNVFTSDFNIASISWNILPALSTSITLHATSTDGDVSVLLSDEKVNGGVVGSGETSKDDDGVVLVVDNDLKFGHGRYVSSENFEMISK